MIYTSAEQLIGHTPLLELTRLQKEYGLTGTLLAKLERQNPAGSAKDRIALKMIRAAEEKGLLHPGSVIIEPTSGNTGIGLAMVGALRGYRVIIVMPDTMSAERRMLMQAYGAELVLTDGAGGMSAAIQKAEELHKTIPDSIIADQFGNPDNSLAHYETTGPEIWNDTQGQVDIFVACVGTGGTLTGTGKYLKQQNPKLRVVAVEPAASPLLSQGWAGPHGIQGIGANFVPAVLEQNVYDQVLAVSDEDAFAFARLMGRKEGILVGISSGAALAAAVRLAQHSENADKRIVVLMPDSGERYLSAGLYTAM